MIRGLLEKEVRQNGTLLIFLLLLLGAGFYVLTSNEALAKVGGSTFYLLSIMWFVILPLVALVLATGLVSSEFRNRTQLFLEGLPMPRWMMLVVKYLLGLAIISICTIAMLAAAWWKGHGAEVMTLNFAMLLSVKLLGWSWFCWAFCFGHGFLGRYRTWTGGSLVLGLLLLQQDSGVQVTSFGPFELISNQFAYERFIWPAEALWITAGLIIGLTAAGFALGLVRDKTLASLLAEKMSTREKVVCTIMTLAALSAVSSHQAKLRAQEPFNLPGAVDFENGVATVSAAAAVSATTPEEEQALDDQSRAVVEMLGQMGAYLDCATLPQVLLIHRPDFTGNQLEIDKTGPTKHVLVRYNFLTMKPAEAGLHRDIIRAVLANHQLDRLDSDTRNWVLEGFATWWPVREQVRTAADFLKSRSHLGELPPRTLHGGDLKRWLKAKKDLTPEQHSTFTGVAMFALGDSGDEPRRRFLAAVLGYSASMGARASLHDWLNPVEDVLKATTGRSFDSLAVQWNAAIPTRKPAP